MERIIEKYSKTKIVFKLRISSYITRYYYIQKYNYEDLIKQLNLNKSNYDNLETIIKYIDTSILDKKTKISENENKQLIYLCFQKHNEKKNCCICLEKNYY